MRTYGSGFHPLEFRAGLQGLICNTAVMEMTVPPHYCPHHSCYVRLPRFDGEPRPAWVSGPSLRFATGLKRNNFRGHYGQGRHSSLLPLRIGIGICHHAPCPGTLSTLVVEHLGDNSRTSIPVGSSIGPTDGAQFAGTLLSCKTGRLMAHLRGPIGRKQCESSRVTFQWP